MNTSHPPVRNGRGFTLLELMITLAIITIISAVALPSYLSSVRKGRRSDAADAATAVLQAQERWRANNSTYTTNFASLNTSTTSNGGYYTLAVSAATATGYTLSFTPVSAKGQQNDAGCTAMTVTVTNGQPTHAPAHCWSR